MEIALVNSLASRRVTTHSTFARLIQSGNCKAYKSTKGNTLHSVEAIKQIVTQHLCQTHELAQALKGSTLAETVQNNYDFLYSHFQYKADGLEQKMRSPECSWADRFKGIDCKSFTIFAASLLLNQQIKCVIRRIKQPGFKPDNWSHVYVVIPKNQNTLELNQGYYIIDATLHDNKEVKYLQKHDTKMSQLPHTWLNGATPTNTVSAHINYQKAITNFTDFLMFLLSQGVSIQTVETIRHTINTYLGQGVDPQFTVNNNGVTIQGTSIPFHPLVNRLNAGVGLTGIDLSGIFNSLFKDGFLSDLFGSIFTNGFDLSCINSTYKSSEVIKVISRIHEPFFKNIVNAIKVAYDSKNATKYEYEINELIKAADISYDMYVNKLSNATDWENCSRKAIDIYVSMATTVKTVVDSMVNDISNRVRTKISNIPSPSSYTYRAAFINNNNQPFGWSQPGNTTYRKITFLEDIFASNVVPKDIVIQPTYNTNPSTTIPTNTTPTTNTTIGTNTYPGTNTYTGPTHPNYTPNSVSKAGFGLTQGILVAGILGAIVYSYGKNNKKSK